MWGKRTIKNWISVPLYAAPQELAAAIAAARVVSFDLYDTLIRRDIPQPAQVHQLVAQAYAERYGQALPGYPQQRMEAERTARKKYREPDLQEIFSCLDLPENRKAALQALETELEASITCADPAMQSLYEMAKQQGKTLVITTDMYLPRPVIESILAKNGYTGYARLYLSSACRKSKAEGSLFTVLLAELSAAPETVLHIGDDVRADHFMPRQKGIRAMLVPGQPKNLRYRRCPYRQAALSPQGCLDRFISNRLPPSPPDETRIGYEVLGPLLLGYCMWLHEKLRQDGIGQVFFLSREGKAIQEAYAILFPQEARPQRYLQVSRQAVMVPLLSQAGGYAEMVKLLRCFFGEPTLATIGRVCGLPGEAFEKALAAIGLQPGCAVHAVAPEKREAVFQAVLRLGGNRFAQQYGLVQRYLAQCGTKGRIALADTGWSGTIQRALARYVAPEDAAFQGYYFCVKDIEAPQPGAALYREGYLSAPGKNPKVNYMLRFSMETLETLLLARGGSVQSYRADADGGIAPVLAEPEYTGRLGAFAVGVQKAAFDFLRACRQSPLFAPGHPLPPEAAMEGYTRFAVYPDRHTVALFEGASFSNVQRRRILPEHGLGYYLLHPKRFTADFNMSGNKILFLKKLLKLPLPYFSFLYFLTAKLKIKSPLRRRYYKNANA